MLKTVIVDDESLSLKLMVSYAEKVPALSVVAQFQNAIDALDYLQRKPVDLLFLDIQMPDITGLELLQSLSSKPLVIFSTAYPEFAVEGFQHDAIDYLVKPVMFPRFLKSVNKAIERRRLLDNQQTELKSPTQVIEIMTDEKPTKNVDYLFVKVNTHWKRIEFSDIRFIESNGDYVSIHTLNNNNLLVLQTLTQMQDKLPANDFSRVHRRFIVNLSHVDTVEKDHLLLGKDDITIGKSYRAELFKKLT